MASNYLTAVLVAVVNFHCFFVFPWGARLPGLHFIQALSLLVCPFLSFVVNGCLFNLAFLLWSPTRVLLRCFFTMTDLGWISSCFYLDAFSSWFLLFLFPFLSFGAFSPWLCAAVVLGVFSPWFSFCVCCVLVSVGVVLPEARLLQSFLTLALRFLP